MIKPDRYVVSGYWYGYTLSEIIESLDKHKGRRLDELYLRRLTMAIIDAVDLGLVELITSKNNLQLRPDKIHCTPHGKFRFNPILPYSASHQNVYNYRYLAPEYLRSEPIQSMSAMLVWNLGVILCHLGHKYPFSHSNSVFVELQNIVETRPKVLDISSGLSPTMCEIINSCLVSRPEHRITFDRIRELLSNVPLTRPLEIVKQHYAGTDLYAFWKVSASKICYVLFCCVNRIQYYLPPELWEHILMFLFPVDTLYYYFLAKFINV